MKNTICVSRRKTRVLRDPILRLYFAVDDAEQALINTLKMAEDKGYTPQERILIQEAIEAVMTVHSIIADKVEPRERICR
jgi:hypothetical protein